MSDAIQEVKGFYRRTGRSISPMISREVLDADPDELAVKLA
jgi:hypothetical protein